jgi:hypothetical protein
MKGAAGTWNDGAAMTSVDPRGGPLTIGARFCGPPDSGNGGYTCGSLAARLAGPVEVTLRRPPPLDRELTVLGTLEGLVLTDGATPVAEARRIRFDLEPPACPGLGAAAEATARYLGFTEHAFPTCFVCGPERSPGDGLRIFAGPVDAGLVAAPWKPAADLAADNGLVRPEFVWAALDCPGAWAWLGDSENPLVLGRLAAVIDAGISPGRLYIVAGWRLGREGRKYYSGTVIWRADGTVCARARATWIEVDPARFMGAG